MKKIKRQINVGNVQVGGTSLVSVQSMTNVDTHDFASTVQQIRAFELAGCDIVRIAVPDMDAAAVFNYAKKAGIIVPLVADIHFDYKIALESLKHGADKIRINPGNIGESWKVKEVANACRAGGVPIRIGVNSGSLDKSLLEKYGSPTAKALAESALTQADILEGFGFSDIVLSIKSSRVQEMIAACRIVSDNSDYPIHLGVTEAGDEYSGLIKSSIGIGSLLADGIGDTIRVSLTADPIKEVLAGREILKSLGLVDGYINIISCPTCGRTKINLIDLCAKFREASAVIDTNGKNITVALMGCVVNGPGEAREADVGIAGGDGCAVLFRKGEIIEKISENMVVEILIGEVKKLACGGTINA